MNNNGNRPQFDTEIDLLELAMLLWKKIKILILCFLIGFGLIFSYFHFMVAPRYQSSSTIYILNKTTSLTSMADIQLGNTLTGDFQQIAYTREVLNQVSSALNLNLSASQLKGMINVTNPSGTHMLRINVTDTDPDRAAAISNQMAEILREQIAEIMNTDKPSFVEKAIPAQSPSGPATLKNALKGGLVAAAAAAGVIVLLYMLDDTIKTDEDVKKYLELGVLAAIPYDPTIQRDEAARKRKRWIKKKFKVKSAGDRQEKKAGA